MFAVFQSNKWCELQSKCEQYQIIINDVVITCGTV